MPVCAAAAAHAGVSAARRSEEVRKRAKVDLQQQQSREQAIKPKDAGSAMLLSMKLKTKEAVPGLEGLDFSPPALSVKGKEGRVYQSKSLFCLRPADVPRRFFIRLVESRPFDPLILITILCNCATMAWESPLDPCCTDKAAFIDVCEWVGQRGQKVPMHAAARAAPHRSRGPPACAVPTSGQLPLTCVPTDYLLSPRYT